MTTATAGSLAPLRRRGLCAIGWAVGLVAFVSACETPTADVEGLEAMASCEYVNQFSELPECREYLGADWDMDLAAEDCDLQDGAFAEGGCTRDDPFGTCVFEGGTDTVYQVVIPSSDDTDCESSEIGCEVFGGGAFVAAEACGGLPDRDLQQGLVFVTPEKICMEAPDGSVGNGPDGTVCAWNQIGGCAEEGQRFDDYGSCDDVRSQRGYYPVNEDSFETPSDDPILQDAVWTGELNWAKKQMDSCGCICCHDSSVTPDGASNWDINSSKGVWTDGFYPSGLAIAAGWIDSSLLGAYPPEENNGFGRDLAGLPSTDQARMVAFFEGELERRGYSREDFADYDPIPAIFYNQQQFEPEACENGEGVARDGTVSWRGGDARYVYVLRPDAANPGSPPNLDTPDGTLWLLEVSSLDAAMPTGLTYPNGPARASQRIAGADLVEGETYYLYVQADVGAPITRCLFTY